MTDADARRSLESWKAISLERGSLRTEAAFVGGELLLRYLPDENGWIEASPYHVSATFEGGFAAFAAENGIGVATLDDYRSWRDAAKLPPDVR
jgi:hypothetical protein